MMTSVSIVREKELGTMEILLVSPLKPYHIILGKVVPYLLLAFLNAVVILLLGIFVFGLPIRGSILLLLFESLLYIMLALSLGIFISTIAKNQMMAMITVDCKGLLCPRPLIEAKKAFTQAPIGETLVIVVDNETAVFNLTSYFTGNGIESNTKMEGSLHLVTVTKGISQHGPIF